MGKTTEGLLGLVLRISLLAASCSLSDWREKRADQPEGGDDIPKTVVDDDIPNKTVVDEVRIFILHLLLLTITL